ncbi:unnamed protein product [Moneuplotes crassus]|uniref:RBR-type E3 ubiquitin transferase n=1 Tax=Euplotes crassus TaxID=5936 RepID=A0AAD1XDB7_EUPCR|nr:unnamed protein product [Moneuplotes crassus]
MDSNTDSDQEFVEDEHRSIRLNPDTLSSDLSSPSKASSKNGKVDTPKENSDKKVIYLKEANSSQFLKVLDEPNPLSFINKKPRGSMKNETVNKQSMMVDRMDSIKSMKQKMYMDPFMRTNQALLKRLDSISTLFNKDGGGPSSKKGAQENNFYCTNFPSRVSQTSNRFGVRDTPMFRAEGISENDVTDFDKRMSSTISGWDNNRGSSIISGNPSQKKISDTLKGVMNIKDQMNKSEVSVISVNEILDFDDYVPFKPENHLEKIDEEKQQILDKDQEERKSTLMKNQPYSFQEARMSEEESYTSRSESMSETSESDNESEYVDHLKVEPNIRLKRASTFNSAQVHQKMLKFQTKLSSQYNRQGTNNSELTMGNYSQKGRILTSIGASKDGNDLDTLIQPGALKSKLKKKMSMSFSKGRLKSKKTFQYRSSSSSKSKIMSIRSYNRKKFVKLIPPAPAKKATNYTLFTSKALRKVGTTTTKDLIIALNQMGFEDEKVEKTIYYGEVKTIEEAMYYLVPDQAKAWEHKFVPEAYCKSQDWCLFCKRQQKKMKKTNSKNGNTSEKSRQNTPDSKSRDIENCSLKSAEQKQVIHMMDKIIVNNRQFVQRKFRNKLSETIQTVSHPGMNAFRIGQRSFKNYGEETPNALLENQEVTEMNIQEEIGDKNSNLGFDISQNDDISESHEFQISKEGAKKSDSNNKNRESSPKSIASEPMNKRLSISIKNEEDHLINNDSKNENIPVKRLTKSKTGIIERESPKHRFPSATSSYRYGDTYLKAGEHEEFCGICNQSFENHSSDFNIELMYLQNKYGEMLNQVTQLDTVSRPFTANSMYSALSRKPSRRQSKLEKVSIPTITVIPEKKTINFRGSPQVQAGSTWNVPSGMKRSFLSSNADSDVSARFEMIRIEHSKARSNCLNYLYSHGIIDNSEVQRRPSQFHQNCPICLEYCKNSFELSGCGHHFCKLCLRGHIEMKIINSLVLDIDCPVPDCKETIEMNVMIQVSTKETIEKYNEYSNNLSFQEDKHFIHCMNCSKLFSYDPQDFLAHCPRCSLEICIECMVPYHVDESCHDFGERRYKEFSKGKSIQLCPHCNQFIEKAKKCNHLTCQRCMAHFCIFCRKDVPEKLKRSKLYMDGYCCNTIKSPLPKSISIQTSKCRIFCLAILFVLLSPIFVMCILPYVSFKNISAPNDEAQEKPQRKRSRICHKLLGILCFLLLICIFPITWVCFIVWVFLVMRKLTSRSQKSGSAIAQKPRYPPHLPPSGGVKLIPSSQNVSKFSRSHS